MAHNKWTEVRTNFINAELKGLGEVTDMLLNFYTDSAHDETLRLSDALRALFNEEEGRMNGSLNAKDSGAYGIDDFYEDYGR